MRFVFVPRQRSDRQNPDAWVVFNGAGVRTLTGRTLTVAFE